MSRAFLERMSELYGVSSDWLLHGHGNVVRSPGPVSPAVFGPIEPTIVEGPNRGDIRVAGKDYAWVRKMGLSVSAGNGLEELPEEEVEGVFYPFDWFVRRGLSPEVCVFVTVKGDSMAPAIPNGAQVMIDRSDRVLRREGIYAFSIDGQAYVKRIVPSGRDKLGRPKALMLVSDNPAFAPMLLTGNELNSLKVAGKVRATLTMLDD